MKKIVTLFAALFSFAAVFADTETVNGVTYTYSISNGKATIGTGGSAAISTSTSGALAIPSTLGGYPVTTIGDYAFYYCSSLTSVTIPLSVTTIGDYAFYYCSSLTSVTIPLSVTTIGESAFPYCSKFQSFTVAAANPSYCTIDGILYTKDRLTLVACPGAKTSVTIPEGVTTIATYAFDGCSSLTSVTIPESMTTIGNWAFLNCRSLTSVTIPEGVTTIGESAFHSCSSLEFVTIPSSVTTIGESAFSYCSKFQSFTVAAANPSYCTIDGILYTKDRLTLVACPGAKTSVAIPGGVTTIGESAFDGCSSLASVTIPDSVTTIGNRAFWGCSVLTSVTIPSSVTTIGGSAFVNCNRLTSVTIPDSVTTIGDSAFSCCSSLTSVTIPSSVTTIGYDAFSWCSSLTSVTIPESVTTIGVYAFSWCSSLTSVTIPEGVMTIGDWAFDGCSKLTSVTIPSSVTKIARDAFAGCSSLTTVNVEAGDTARVKGLLADSGFDVSSLTFREIPKQESDSGEGKHHITFVVSDGEASLAEANYPTNGVYGRLPEARREGFTFAGWYTAFDGGMRVGAFSTINPEVTTLYARWVEQDASLYAQWAANVYAVNFNANGGSGAMAAQPFLYDQTQPLSANGFTKTGYTFKGWSTSPEGEVVFADAAAVSNLTAEAGFTVALFAQWNKTVELDTDDISDWVAYDLADQYAAKHGTNARGYRDLFRSTFGNDYSAAFHKETVKVAADGTRLQVWHDYVAGTDPLDPESKFTASMTMVDGKPVVSWTPELDAERAAIRKYTTYGKVKLTDSEWTVVPEGRASDYNFFKVTVEMK